MDTRMTIRVSGAVQGVSFRAYAKERADQLGLTGHAQNMPDGTVFIEAQGPREQMQEFLSWCHQGPPISEVERVEFSEHESLKDFSNFHIL